jgi:hypothetical protein
MTNDQKKMLVLLSEAEEEDLLVLINTVAKGDRSTQRMRAIVDAAKGLLTCGCCVMSERRNISTLRLVPLALRESSDLLSRSLGSIAWDGDESLWVWRGDNERPQVVLTSRGVDESHKILRDEGWIG